jgi:hypothetical protein
MRYDTAWMLPIISVATVTFGIRWQTENYFPFLFNFSIDKRKFVDKLMAMRNELREKLGVFSAEELIERSRKE